MTREGARMLSRSTLLWWSTLPPRGFGVLTTRGRTSGKERRTCVRVHRRGQKAYLVGIVGDEAYWFRNVRADPSVTIRLEGGSFKGTAREIVDPAEREEARQVYVETLTLFDRAEGLLHLKGQPTASKIRDLHRRWFTEGIPLVIDLRGRV